jgi:hypothetical protein
MAEKKATAKHTAKQVAANSAKNATPNARAETPAKQVAPPPKDPQALALNGTRGDTFEQTKAKAATKASINAVMVINAYQGNIMGKDVDITEMVTDMQGKFKEVADGNLSNMEAMLVGQATALQTMFTSLAQRAAGQEHLKQYQTFMILALKAQAQSRATISALVDLKYPKQASTFVKQANIANGPQQVNNGNASASAHTGISTPSGTHAGDYQSEPNKLLERQHLAGQLGLQSANAVSQRVPV